MGRRSSRRAARTSRRPLSWPLGLAAAVVVAAGAWWVLSRSGAGGEAGSLASYRPPDIHSLAVRPDDPSSVFFGSHRGLLVSHDAGRTWSPLGPSGDAMGIAAPPNSSTMYAAGHDAFLRSDDAGRTWSSVRPALPGSDVHGLAASASRPGTFYAFVVGQGIFRSEDAGRTWQRIPGQPPGSTMSLTAVASANDVLYASTMQGVQRSRDGGATWEPVPELGGAYVAAAGAHVYAVTDRQVVVSDDGGASWQTRAFPAGGAVLVAAAPSEPSVVYVVTRELAVYRSADAGRTWERMG